MRQQAPEHFSNEFYVNHFAIYLRKVRINWIFFLDFNNVLIFYKMTASCYR